MNREDFDTRPINTKLRDVLYRVGMTQAELAELANIPRQYISFNINGRSVVSN